MCNKSGAKIQDAPKLIKNEETELKGKLNPKNVAIHLGTNNVSDSQTRSMDIMMTFTSTIAGILDYFPDITLGICSIPPGKGGGATRRESNKIARGLNAFLEVHCRQKQDQLVYIDTWFVLWNTAEQPALKRLYASQDSDGIHINKEGKKQVINHIKNTMRRAHSKRKHPTSTPSPQSNQKPNKGARFDKNEYIVHAIHARGSKDTPGTR